MLLASTVTGALIGAAAALAGSLLGFASYWLGRKVPDDVRAFATQASGALDGLRQALVGVQRGADDTQNRVDKATIYVSETHRLLGGAMLELNARGRHEARALIGALHDTERLLHEGDPSATERAIKAAEERQAAFHEAASKSRR